MAVIGIKIFNSLIIIGFVVSVYFMMEDLDAFESRIMQGMYVVEFFICMCLMLKLWQI